MLYIAREKQTVNRPIRLPATTDKLLHQLHTLKCAEVKGMEL